MEQNFIRPIEHLAGKTPDAPDWFKRAIEAECDEGEVEVCGATIKFTTWGAVGSPGLLFVHGGRAHRDWWRPFAPFFANDFRVAALDLSGLGDSGWRDAYDVEVSIQELLAVIEAAELGANYPPVVIGHSFGGWITLSAVEHVGEKLAGAVVIDSAITVPDPNEGYDLSKLPRFDHGQLRKNRVYETIEEPISRFRFLPQQPCDEHYIVDYIARNGLRQEGSGWTWKFDPAHGANFQFHYDRDLFIAPRCPLAFIYGERSLMAQGDGFMHLREQTANRSPFVIVPGAHHHLMIDSPIAFISTLRMLFRCWPVRIGN